jgi:predicted transcriptional regulator
MAAERKAKGRKIEIDRATAELLQARAAALGISVAELMAAIVGDKPAAPQAAATPAAAGEPQAAAGQPQAATGRPLDPRWREVKAWIDSWGKSNELPRPKLGK